MAKLNTTKEWLVYDSATDAFLGYAYGRSPDDAILGWCRRVYVQFVC